MGRRTYSPGERAPSSSKPHVYRYFHQHGPLRGSAFGYRSKEEEEAWMARDPVTTYPDQLIKLGVIDEAAIERIAARVQAAVDAAADGLTETDPETNTDRVIPALWPDPASVQDGMRGDLSELAGSDYREPEDVPAADSREIKYIEAIALAQLRAMERDETVVVLGEDVHRLGGGTVGATKGIAERYGRAPDRHADHRERLLRARARRRHQWSAARRRDHVCRFLPRRCGSAVQSDRQDAPHVRRRLRRARGGPGAHRGRRRLWLATLNGRERPVRPCGRAGASSRQRRRSTISVCSTAPFAATTRSSSSSPRRCTR